MKIVRVTYTTQPGYAGQNAGNIQQVMSDLRELGSMFASAPTVKRLPIRLSSKKMNAKRFFLTWFLSKRFNSSLKQACRKHRRLQRN